MSSIQHSAHTTQSTAPSAGDRIRVLLEEYQNATERLESLESELERRDQRLDELEEALAEARNQGGVLSS